VDIRSHACDRRESHAPKTYAITPPTKSSTTRPVASNAAALCGSIKWSRDEPPHPMPMSTKPKACMRFTEEVRLPLAGPFNAAVSQDGAVGIASKLRPTTKSTTPTRRASQSRTDHTSGLPPATHRRSTPSLRGTLIRTTSLDEPQRCSTTESAGEFDWHEVPGRLSGEVQLPPQLMIQLSGVASG